MSESSAAGAASQQAVATARKATEAAQEPAQKAVGGKVVTTKPAADTRTPAQIEADLIATRQRLAGRIDEVTAYVAPKAVARRQVQKVKSFYVDEFGGIRPERVLATAAVGLVAVGLLIRRARRS